MSFSLAKSSMRVRCKHPSTKLRMTVRLSEGEVCVVNLRGLNTNCKKVIFQQVERCIHQNTCNIPQENLLLPFKQKLLLV
jgi:translation initiation factor IF-1